MIIEINTETKTITPKGACNLKELFKQLSKWGIDLEDYKIGEEPLIYQYPWTSPHDGTYHWGDIITCSVHE